MKSKHKFNYLIYSQSLEERKNKMNEQGNNFDPQNVLCKVTDVSSAIEKSFQKFIDEEKKSLDELANCLREELSKMELFVPGNSDDQEK